MFTIVSITLTELNQGRVQIYSNLTRVSGLMGVCLIIITLPGYINSRPPFVLLKNTDIGFLIAGGLIFVHYLAGGSFYFAVRYETGIPYFDGSVACRADLSKSRCNQ